MNYTIVAGIGNSGELGLDNKLLWRLPEDLKSFKAITMGKSMVMGRKTFDSIGRALPGRETIILTRDKSYTQDGCTIINSVEQLEEYANSKGLSNLMIVGGGEIYNLFMEKCSTMLISHVDYDGQADTVFPKIIEDQWHLEIVNSYEATEKTLSWKLCKYTRKS